MLRELITWVLNNYLGKYVENLNTAQLTVALLSGEVELENLPLRRDALQSLGLPLEALSGVIGKVKLQVPVRQFRTAPWCIFIENIYIVVGPTNLNEWDNEKEEQIELDYKLSKLHRNEAQWRAEKETSSESSYYASSYTGWLNYGTSLITNVMENLQLKINDVHIRYEDTITVLNHRFACGITIDSLSAQSCDSNWLSGFTSNWYNNAASFKLIELQSFSFYWDLLNNDETFGNIESSELVNAIQSNNSKWSHQFIINPVSAQARLKRDRCETPLRTRSRPRLVCDLTLNEISLNICDWQYNQMAECTKQLEEINKYKKFHLLRPNKTVKDNPKLWWLYALKCHGVKYSSKIYKLNIAKENIKYINIYKKLLFNPNEPLSIDDKEHKDKVEKLRTYDELKLLQEICMRQLPKINTKNNNANQGRSVLLQWFPQWWGWYNNTNNSPNNEIAQEIIDGQEIKEQIQLEDELLNALSDTVENNSLLKRDTVFGKFNFTLSEGTLNLCSGSPGDKNSIMIQLQFENLILDIESRPRSDSYFIGLSLGSMYLKDRITINTEFPDLLKPQVKDDNSSLFQSQKSRIGSLFSMNSTIINDPLFELHYERRPLSYHADYRLYIRSKSLDIVYNMDAIKWLIDFFLKPYQIINTTKKIEVMKHKTKMELFKNWENILEGDLTKRKVWAFEIDISAPRIIFAENLSDINGSIILIDFGRFQLTNDCEKKELKNNQNLNNSDNADYDSENDDEFMTPCSTPPGSKASTDDSITLCTALSEIPETSSVNTLSECLLKNKFYDHFNLNLTDLQILICKAKEKWSFASAKGTSSFHILDRFNIALEIDRRIIPTTDPQYPNLTLSGTLPKLVAHINEYKIGTIVAIFNILSKKSYYSSPTNDENYFINDNEEKSILTNNDDDLTKDASKQIILQFSIDQIALEVQSRARSVAELQVTGVKVGFSKRSVDTNITLSVHSLLLVDAIQSFGPDFELLIASHRHVGMDSVSGSLKQSEPCSPISPGSPDPLQDYRRPTSPHTISRALSSLQRETSLNNYTSGDLDALITVEILFVTPEKDDEKLQIANIQFNNLDIIANQETIVELIGFANRVMPRKRKSISNKEKFVEGLNQQSLDEITNTTTINTQIQFDFHRLNVLVLRAIMRDNYLVGRKVGTFTMSEARINATLGSSITVEGSLGGLQVLNLTPEGVNHQRILSVGKDPLTEPIVYDLLHSLTQEVYAMGQNKLNQHSYDELKQALSFSVTRNLNAHVDIKIRMASVWYTHCARFMQELNWCATEFKHYLKNLAKSIRDKATDMALGLVQQRYEMTKPVTQSFDYDSPRQSVFPLISTPTSNKLFLPKGPTKPIDIRLDIVLQTPVLVIPRSSSSSQVLVAHLGKISINNCQDYNDFKDIDNKIFTINEDYDIIDDITNENNSTVNNYDTYMIDIRNMNMYSLDTHNRKGFRFSALPRAEEFYSCDQDAVAILHDTAVQLKITRITEKSINIFPDINLNNLKKLIQINGCVVTPLQLSLSRQQYEQLLETVENIFKTPIDIVRPPTDIQMKQQQEQHKDVNDITQNEFFEPNNKFKKNLFPSTNADNSNFLEIKTSFDLPNFIILLKNDTNNPLIEISFRDFNVNYDRSNQYETNIQVSLRSVQMEDLLRPVESKHRIMVISSSPKSNIGKPQNSFVSTSCPNLCRLPNDELNITGSLPENLESEIDYLMSQCNNSNRNNLNINQNHNNNKTMCPDTPPPSPQRKRQDNLVLYSSLIVDPDCPTFETQYKSIRQSSSIDFNCLDLIISLDSWFILLNFFGLLSDDADEKFENKVTEVPKDMEPNVGFSEMEISVRSLTVVLTKTNYDIAKANVSKAYFMISKHGVTKTVEGKLGSISLTDLTTHGILYREKFLTSGNEALSFIYLREKARSNVRSLIEDSKLKIQMSTVRFVYTKRFITEIQDFFKKFSQLQTPVMRKIKSSESQNQFGVQKPIQINLEINAESPIILLPMSSKSEKLLYADFGKFSIKNSFHYTNEVNIISKKADINQSNDLIIDKIFVNLINTDIYTGIRLNNSDNLNDTVDNYLNMGSYIVIKKDKSLLKHKCQLKLQIERNMDTWKSHNVPDISVQGTLSRLEIVLNLQDYMLIRGFLSYNLGELLDDLNIEQMNLDFDQNDGLNEEQKTQQLQVWTTMSITLDLQDVSLRLEIPNNLDIDQIKDLNYYLIEKTLNNINNNNILLACINFIKSSLKIDTFSDGTQDIDLVSQEIIVKDTRFINNNINEQLNVFTNILQSINNYKNNLNNAIRDDNQQTSVQAEIHARKRQDITKYTILLNNMRLMVILDWLEIIRDFLKQSDECITTNLVQKVIINDANNQQDNPIEVILFITDSEFVFVEKTNQLDTNAIILKSTTVISYRPSNLDKVMSINLTNLEVFSCILGSEEATALSIIDPVTIHLDVKQGVLDVQLEKQICIRLSYSDMKLFLQMMESLPKQRKTPLNRNISVHNKSLNKLSALGFKQNDCEKALTICNQQLDEAALWLTQNAEPLKHFQQTTDKALYIYSIEIHATCISICVIDDCRDADVPFLEISLSQLDLRQELDVPPDVNRLNELAMIDHSGLSPSGCVRTGHLKAIFGSDYYNRALSGWEPLIEPWKCEAYWDYSISPRELQANRLHINFLSDDQLKLNITSDVLNLFKLVHDNWVQDYYGNNNLNPMNSINQLYRQRTPFIPFALKNETGVKLWFTTLVSSPGGISHNETSSETKSENSKSTWKSVEPGEVISFSFDLPNKQRHQDSHKLNLHQIRVRFDGWDEVGPVAVDRVGIYFRHTLYETISQFSQLKRARIVFAVSLEGSARKLITVRSALQVSNRLDCPILLKMEHILGHLNIMTWPDTKTTVINSNEIYNVPLSHVHSFLYVRPHNINYDNNKTIQSSSIDKNKMNGNDYWTKYDCYNSKSNLLKQTSTTTSSTSILNGNQYQYCDKSIHWKDGNDISTIHTDMRTCKSINNKKFRIFITIKKNNYPIKEGNLLPGHIITLWPPLRLVNLLPCDLLYCLPSDIQGRVLTTETANIYDIDFDDQSSQLIIAIDNYPGKGLIKIPCGYNCLVDLRLKLIDTNNRILNLIATLQFDKGSGLQIFISSPFWLVNRTGLPLIFRQEGVAIESSGQFPENEQARLVSPLMFSFADPDAPPTLICRLGKRYGSNPPFCQPFNLDKDLSYRQLKSGNTNETFVVGIEIQRGRGLYAKTTTVIFSPRFQLYNRSSYKLQFTQKYFTTIMTDKSGQLTYMEAISGCHIPFHWPRLDKEPEICIRLPDVPDCLWSGGVPIQETQSLYINIRNSNGDMHFLRLEIILQGATYYLLFGDAQTLPPPIRIDNYSEVPMKFYQPDCKNQWRTVVKPHSSIAYALDEPMGSQSLQIEAPGGVAHLYYLKDLGMSYNLTYENFIYIAFTGTFKLIQDNNKKNIDIEQQQLVLGVINNRVVLTRKQTGDRSQLWRMNQDKQLEHEGSSPPVEPGKKPMNSLRYVLDIEKPPQPMHYINLVVRPANKQRKSTQTWHFTEEGRLMCEHSNMCVQARGGFFGLRPGSDAVLGMTSSETHMTTKNLIPIEQAIERQKLRPGSGCISVSVNMDGPIKTIQVKDIKYLSNKVLAIDPKWKHVSHIASQQNAAAVNSNNSTEKLNTRKFIGEYHIVTKIKRGLGISLVSRNPSEELAFITLESILMESIITKHIRSIDLSIGDMQIDNQLFETPCSVMLYSIKGDHNDNSSTWSTNTNNNNSNRIKLSALQLNVKMLPSPNENAIIFEHFILSLRPIAINIEERLLLRLVDFFGLVKIQINHNNTKNLLLIDNDNYIDEQQIITNILSSNVKRYYFGDLQLIPSQIRLSVLTASKLTTNLNSIKKSLGLTLIKFEDAIIDFEKFIDKYHFETLDVYMNAIKNHYKKELKWQAAAILGSVDFLGNPLGLANDLSEGVSGLLFEGSVTSLLKNVTHGLSNSTAKLTETLSHGLGKVVLDEQDTETRQKILEVPDGINTTSDHLMAGLKGFGFGLLGGVTSIVKHTYTGAQSDGIQGLLTGFGRGLVGTVTKPVIGVLDLASETANAVKETSRSSNRSLPERKRLPRCVISAPSNLLPQYSFKQSKGQQLLFAINKRNFTEQFMAYEPHLFDAKNSKFRLLVSNEHVWIFSRTEDTTTILLSYHLSDMVSCHAVSVNSINFNNNNNDVNNTVAIVGGNRQQQQQQQHHQQNVHHQQHNERNSKTINHYIELCLTLNSSNKSVQNSEQEAVKRPRVRCQTEEMAQKASYHINYAKGIYDQRKQTLNFDSVME